MNLPPFGTTKVCPKCGSKTIYRIWYDAVTTSSGDHSEHMRCYCNECGWVGPDELPLDATNSSESPNGCPADTAPMVVGEPTGPDADALARVNAARDATEECKAELRAPPKGRTCMDCWESFNTDGSDWLGCWSQVGLVRRDAPACDNFVPRSATPNTPEFPDGCCIDAIRDAIAAVDLEPPTHSLEEPEQWLDDSW